MKSIPFYLLCLSACALAACTPEDEGTTDPTLVIVVEDMSINDSGNMPGDVSGDASGDTPGDTPADLGMTPDQGQPDMGTDMTTQPPPEGCEGFELTMSGGLDLDLKRVRVQGTLTLNGTALPIPDDGFNAGSLIFTHVDGLSRIVLPLSGMQQTYTLDLKPGTYHVDYQGDAAACSKSDEPSLYPCNQGRLISSIPLTQQGVLDLNIPAITVQGTVSLNGEALPDFDGSVVGITLREDTYGSARHALNSDKNGRYGLTILPGQYSIGWDGDEARCAGVDDLSPMPCNDGVIQSELNLQQSGVLDVSVESIQITGSITLNQEVINELDPGAASSLAWSSDTSPLPVVTSAYSPGDAATYAVHLLKGVYDVSWIGDPGYCNDLDGKQDLPCHTGILQRDLSLNTSGSLDFDLETVKIYGPITLNGQTVPDTHEAQRGVPTLTDADGNLVVLPTTRRAQALGYTVNVLRGDYRTGWSGNPALCQDADADHGFPCHAGLFGQTQPLMVSGELPLDVPSVRVTGMITLNGATLPDEDLPRGQLVMVHATHGEALSAMLDADGAATYRVALLPGTYDIAWRPATEVCAQDLEKATQIPCSTGYPLRSQSLNVSGSLNVDLQAITLTGTVTQESMDLAEPTHSGRGRLHVQAFEQGGITPLPSFKAQGPVRYAITLYPGRYLLEYLADPTHCVQGREGDYSIVCGQQIIKGCEEP